MNCPKCKSDNIQAVTKKKRRGFLNILMNAGITLITGGIWLVILIVRGRKEQTRFVCMDCGKEFRKCLR